ncbi:class I SAM-dependent DNA methyltransferase [Evansella clarkii]|jgi:SAM-dependent methyltransferase|uniref:class I SAM-dependent DNA methyltransferase n=1 Tax=Evansella clarkii TaxID=79879 RepID=UPI000996B284|nr:class I SAM-dependent methyltransferase [Evansella clarkii]
MKNEEHFASVYDYLMEDAPYDRWLEYTTAFLPAGSRVLDLACGTCTFTIMLQEAGFNASGTDLSQDMLTIGEEKIRERKLEIPLYRQDMRELTGFNNLDGITLFCDGLNYLLTEEDVQQAFKKAYSALKPGGILLFDVHSLFKMNTIFNDQMYGENGEDISYIWFCTPGREPDSVEHSLTFFLKTHTGLYERKDEEQFQRTFPPEIYKTWLQEAGFSKVEITGDFGRREPLETDERIFIKAEKNSRNSSDGREI